LFSEEISKTYYFSPAFAPFSLSSDANQIITF